MGQGFVMKLENYLDKKKINQSSFAQMIGVSRTHANKMIKGRRTPSFKLAKKIQEVTEGLVTIDDFPMEPIDKHKKK